MFRFLIVSALILGNAWAGNGSHGGDGLIINGKPYLLDLIEHGVEKMVTFSPPGKCSLSKETLRDMLNPSINEKNVREIITQKLYELCTVSNYAAVAISKASNSLFYSYVKLSLVNIKDEETPLQYPKDKLVQLAVRQNNRVLIDSEKWNLLDDWNKAGLIMHEIVYAMTAPESFDVYGYRGKKQSSPHARQIVGGLFSGQILSIDSKVREEILSRIVGDGHVLHEYIDGSFGYVLIGVNPVDYKIKYYQVAESSKLTEITQIARKVCAVAASRASYPQQGEVGVSINVSASDLESNTSKYRYYEESRVWLDLTPLMVLNQEYLNFSIKIVELNDGSCMKLATTYIEKVYQNALLMKGGLKY